MSVGRMGLVQAGSPDKQCPTLAELTADATATASQIAEGATAYVQGEKITGTMPTTIDVASAGIKVGYSTFETVPSYFDFSSVTNASSMFSNCNNLSSIDGIDFSSVTDASFMFSYCKKLSSIDGIDFSSVTNASSMFRGCEKLSSIDGIDFSSVTNAVDIFYYCYALTEVNNFQLPLSVNTQSLFNHCINLKSVSGLYIPKTTTTREMFFNCTSLTDVDIVQTNTIFNTILMFSGCSSLTYISVLDFSNVSNATNMFADCTNLTTIGNIIFLKTSLSLSDSPNLDENTLSLFGIIATGPGQTGLADLKALGLSSETITFNTTSQEFLESEGIIAKLTDSNWVVSVAGSM